MSCFFNSFPRVKKNYSTPFHFAENFDFSRYLAGLSEPLYEHVRPRIIHEPHIVLLSELCLLFQTQFMRDPDEGISYSNGPNESRD
jgi:hypothetical protein